MKDENPVTYFARVNSRGDRRRFGILRADRRFHIYILGRTGMGKSRLLRTLATSDILSGEGLACFDPHGDLVESLRSVVPPARAKDLIYLDPTATGSSFVFNPLEGVSPARFSLQAASIVDVFRKLWQDSWGPRLEHLLRNVVLALLETPGTSLGDVPQLLLDRTWRRGVVARLKNERVRSFWEKEYDYYTPGIRSMVTSPLLNKVGALLGDTRLEPIFSGRRSSLNLRQVMDEGKILLINLSKGCLGEGPSSLLGSLLLSHLALSGYERAEVGEEERRDFHVFLDEFHTFATPALAGMLSELRKYRVNVVLAHQYLSQLDDEVRDAVLGNAGTLVSFRLGPQDAPFLSREFGPEFSAEDLLRLPRGEVYLKLMIGGAASRPFSATTYLG